MSIKIACHACKHKIAECGLTIFSNKPPSCECGGFEFPHSHRGAPGRARVIPHKCAFCRRELEFLNVNVDYTVNAVSFEAPCPKCQQDADELAGKATKAVIVFHDCGKPN